MIRSLGPRLAPATVLLALCGLLATPAFAAHVVDHDLESRVTGADVPGGPFQYVLGVAVDNSGGFNDGDLYVGHVIEAESSIITKLNEAGSYDGLQIDGADTPQGSLSFFDPEGLASSFDGLAVDSSAGPNSGSLYLVHVEGGVVQRFAPNGDFVCEISGRVTPTPDECAGLAGSATPDGGMVPLAVVVSESTGHLYVVDHEHQVINEFDEDGKYVGQIKDPHLVQPSSIDLDSKGNVYVTNSSLFGGENADEVVVKFSSAGAFLGVVVPITALAVAVDRKTDHVYVTQGFGKGVGEYDDIGSFLGAFPTGSRNSPTASLAVDADSGRIYVGNFYPPASIEFVSPDTIVPDVIIDPPDAATETTVELSGTVDPGGAGDVVECRFEYGTTTAYGKSVPCLPATPYSGATDVTASVSGLTPSTTYHFRLVARSSGFAPYTKGVFGQSAMAEVVDQWAYAHLRSATVEAKINPHGLPTECRVEFVRRTDFEESGYVGAKSRPCTESIGSGFTERVVRAELENLHSGSEYHFRFIATNDIGTVIGGDEEFSTFGIKSFSIEDVDEEGNVLTQAGARPFATITRFEFTHTDVPTGSGTRGSLAAFVKDIITEQPAGRVGYTDNTPRCLGYLVAEEKCGGGSQVGKVNIEVFQSGGRPSATRAQYNVFTPFGVASRYASVDPYTFSDARIRTGGDYGTTGGVFNLTEEARMVAVVSTIWGVPADPLHDPERHCTGIDTDCSSAAAPAALLRNPTSCTSPKTARTRISTWQDPGEYLEATVVMPAITGCDKLEFDPSIEWQPTTKEADSPTGLRVNIHVPQNENPAELAVPDMRNVEITPAEGLVFNPAAAAGLVACTEAQFDYHGEGPSRCPDAGKIGTVEVNTPQLDHPVHGGIYMATPYENPFDTLFAMYIAIDDPRTGVVVKMPGEIELDPEDGQLTAMFLDNPQLPMEDFKLEFFDGPRAVLRTPTTCGSYVTEATLTPWSAPQSGPPEQRTDSYEIISGPGGSPCVSDDAQAPHDPTFQAGTLDRGAGAFSPFVVHVARADGSQQLAGLTVSPPPGLMGKLEGIASCPAASLEAADARTGTAEKRSPSCPAESEVGSVSIALGAGSKPLHVPGRIYLSGAYRGAPLSLGIVVPALGGPYDLGTVVVRTALHVDHVSGRLRVESEPLPKILEGVPLDMRSITVRLDRPGFTVNPTNCKPKPLDAAVTSTTGRVASLAVPFQVHGCGRLPFEPRLDLRLLGRLGHGDNPSLRAVLRMPPGGANLARTAVTLPPSLFLDNDHIRGICTRPRFEAGSCPKNAVYAHAKVWTPLLDEPLQGPVYMRTSDNPLPDLVADLGGGIRFTFGAGVGTRQGGISTDIGNLPDVAMRKFVLTMRGGANGLLQNSVDACAGPQRGFVEFVGQNGKVERRRPLLRASCPSGRGSP